jgi:hypothetical protein
VRPFGVYIFDFTLPSRGGGEYDQIGIWGKNMKTVKRKEEGKKDKKEEKRGEKNKNHCNFPFIAQIFLYNRLLPVHLYFFPHLPF